MSLCRFTKVCQNPNPLFHRAYDTHETQFLKHMPNIQYRSPLSYSVTRKKNIKRNPSEVRGDSIYPKHL